MLLKVNGGEEGEGEGGEGARRRKSGRDEGKVG